jgi:hypothetical protein
MKILSYNVSLFYKIKLILQQVKDTYFNSTEQLLYKNEKKSDQLCSPLSILSNGQGRIST